VGGETGRMIHSVARSHSVSAVTLVCSTRVVAASFMLLLLLAPSALFAPSSPFVSCLQLHSVVLVLWRGASSMDSETHWIHVQSRPFV
jgi:hypothetical protein